MGRKYVILNIRLHFKPKNNQVLLCNDKKCCNMRVKDIIAKLFYVRVTVGGWEDPSQRILHLFIQINTLLENVVFRAFLFPVTWNFWCGLCQLHYSFRGQVAFLKCQFKVATLLRI